MISFERDEQGLVLHYAPDFNALDWIKSKLEKDDEVTLSRSFTFLSDDLLAKPEVPDADDDDDEFLSFRFAAKEGDYYRIPGRVLGCERDVLIAATGIRFERKTFVAERNVGIFPRIEKIVTGSGEIAIGGLRQDAIPNDVFQRLQAKFPTSLELDRYASARVETILSETLEGNTAARERYEAYLARRGSSVSAASLPHLEIVEAEIEKFVMLRGLISDWLKDATSYSERDWQALIIKVVLLLLPRYVAVLENVKVADFYSHPERRTNRFIDVCLVDSNGSIDVIEIKKPFDGVLLAGSKYRDNYVPGKALSGTIMQAEKYIFHLSKWGVEGEKELTKRHARALPDGMRIRVTNPKAIVLLGRDKGADGSSALDDTQLFDLEVIKRKFSNVVDIISYDDLLRRLDNSIAMWNRRKSDLS